MEANNRILDYLCLPLRSGGGTLFHHAAQAQLAACGADGLPCCPWHVAVATGRDNKGRDHDDGGPAPAGAASAARGHSHSAFGRERSPAGGMWTRASVSSILSRGVL